MSSGKQKVGIVLLPTKCGMNLQTKLEGVGLEMD